jgi:hypothetical protein
MITNAPNDAIFIKTIRYEARRAPERFGSVGLASQFHHVFFDRDTSDYREYINKVYPEQIASIYDVTTSAPSSCTRDQHQGRKLFHRH